MTTAYLYQRVSTTEQDTARQHAANRAAAALRGWEVREYCDDGLGASSLSRGSKAGAQRPDYRALVADILSAQPGDVLVLHDVSRADRQLETWSALLAQCRRHGVLVYVTDDDQVYDPGKANHWRLLATAGVQAEAESLVKGDQIRSGMAYWKSQGHPSGRVTYGITRKRDPDKIRNRWLADVPNPDTAPIARRIVLAVAAAQSYGSIARALESEGIARPAGGKAWCGSSVVNVARHAREYAALGMVTDRQADDCLAALRSTAGMGRGSGAKAMVHRYTGCVTCRTCGERLRGSQRAGKGVRYVCPAGHVSVQTSQVDTYIDAWAIARLCRPDALTLFADTGQRAAADAARRQADDMQAELDQWVTSGISARAYALKEADMMPKIRAALALAQSAVSVPALAGLPDSDHATVAARWESLTVSARKAAIKVLAPDATIGPGKGTGRMLPVEERIAMA